MENARRTVSTKIIEACLELLAEKPFADITVTDVVRRAEVARASFYRNFASTSEVIDAALDGLVRKFEESALPVLVSQDEQRWRAFLFRYIYLVSDQRQWILLSRSSNSSVLLFRITDATRKISQRKHYDNVKEKYCIPTRVAAITSVIMRWMDDDCREAPEELVDYLMSFILKI